MSKEERILMCHLVSDFKDAPPAVSSVDTCQDCKRAIWRAHSSPAADLIVCMECGHKRFRDEPNAKIELPTREQVEEAMWWFLNFGR